MIFKFLLLGLCSTICAEGWNHHDLKNLLEKYIEIDHNNHFSLSKNYEYVMIDVGLYKDATQSQIWLETSDSLLILGFEPANINWDSLSRNSPIIPGWFAKDLISSNHSLRKNSRIAQEWRKRFFPFKIALGNSDQTTTTFYETKNHSACSSIYEPYQFPYSSYTVPIVPLRRILDFFPFEAYPVIDYIKIDAQGADLDILKGMGHYLNERVICVTAEPEQNAYKNTNNSIEEILHFMQQQGFKRMKNSRVEDPTFVNKKFMNLFYEKRLNKIIYQEG